MSSLAAPANMDRQASTQSTTPLLNSSPSVEPDREQEPDTKEETQAAPASENGNGLHMKDASVNAKNGVGEDKERVGGGAGQGQPDSQLQNGSHDIETGRTDVQNGAANVYRGTTIPIREEFRCRRFWFFYHDVRALTTSWLPLPIFLVYRIFIIAYIFAWMIASGVDRSPRQGPKWLIFITNQSIIILLTGLIAITALQIGYTIVYYVDKDKLQRFYPRSASTRQAFYSQDNIAWYMKICWILYIIGVTTELTKVCGYWVVVYRPCSSDDVAMMGSNSTMLNSTQNETTMMPDTLCETFEVISIHVHLIIGLLAILDIYINRVPYQILHIFYGIIYMAFFVIFTGIYFGAGGSDHLGNPYIYSAFNYGENPGTSTLFCFLVLLVPIACFLVLFFLAWLRDVIYTRIGFCFRDVRQYEYRVTSDKKSNGELEPTPKVEFTTKI